MRTMATSAALALVTALLVACGGDSNTGGDGGQDPGIQPDYPGDDLQVLPELQKPEGITPVDVETGEAGDPGTDIPADVPPEPGEFGWPCTENSQCLSNFCLETPEGMMCTKQCLEECPNGWSCKNITVGSDLVSVCVPLFLRLCEPCSENQDCGSELSGGNALCIDKGGVGRFCGGDCTDSDCPDGYSCEEVSDGVGGTKMQCTPNSGVCECSTRAIQLGLSTECFNDNEFGMCFGTRKCVVAGLTPCSASTAQEEECNGLDDDCDDLTDEVQGQIECEKKNDHGICKGFGECSNGSIVSCDAETPAPEMCNGIDDDCNGETDDALCYDGNDCTKDTCEVGSGECVFEPIAGPCDDGNLCTLNDHCESGQCVGGGAKVCDDGNPCTDDVCDSGSGECKPINNSAPCEDGNKCTQNDTCLNGACQSGQVKDCSDDNMCTLNELCDANSGLCTFTPNDGAPCDDGDGCTKSDVCSGGQCIGPTDWCEGQAITCTPGPGQLICLPLKCVLIPIIETPSCPCVCI